MSRWEESIVADVGYKIKVGDYIVLTTPFNMTKGYRVTSVTLNLARCELKGRHDMYFPRIYSLPFDKVQSKPSTYNTMNTWNVRVNDMYVKNRVVKS